MVSSGYDLHSVEREITRRCRIAVSQLMKSTPNDNEPSQCGLFADADAARSLLKMPALAHLLGAIARPVATRGPPNVAWLAIVVGQMDVVVCKFHDSDLPSPPSFSRAHHGRTCVLCPSPPRSVLAAPIRRPYPNGTDDPSFVARRVPQMRSAEISSPVVDAHAFAPAPVALPVPGPPSACLSNS